MYLLVLLVTISGLVRGHGDSNGRGSFIGNEHWRDGYLELCQESLEEQISKDEGICISYHINFERVNVEIHSFDPLLVVYRGFATEDEVEMFLDDVHTKQLELQKVAETQENVFHTSRRANGTWLQHEEMTGVAQMFWKTQRLIPNVNFDSSESWQVLSYLPGGHYAPHYDYLYYNDPSEYDYWMNNYGNRFATYLLVLKTADVGGGTVFPELKTTVIPQKGDVIYWHNMNNDHNMATRSLHGACPIYEGNKIAATLWIRQKDQKILSRCDIDDPLYIDPHFVIPANF